MGSVCFQNCHGALPSSQEHQTGTSSATRVKESLRGYNNQKEREDRLNARIQEIRRQYYHIQRTLTKGPKSDVSIHDLYPSIHLPPGYVPPSYRPNSQTMRQQFKMVSMEDAPWFGKRSFAVEHTRPAITQRTEKEPIKQSWKNHCTKSLVCTKNNTNKLTTIRSII